MELVLDAGNARIKWHNPHASTFGDFRHALVALSENQWRKVTGRGIAPDGFIRVNGQPYALGDAARSLVIHERPTGASRYHDTYYGVALAYALYQAFGQSTRNVFLMGSHAPVDQKYARNLEAAAKHKWEVVADGATYHFDVKDVFTYDEPLGGYMHFTFTEDGNVRKHNPLANVTTLVIDVGGYTTDIIAIDPGGNINLLTAKSTRTGTIKLLEQFEEELRANNATLFQQTGDIDIRRLEDALITGQFRFGKTPIDCAEEARGAINSLVNDVADVITSAGGAANFDAMLLTGGGAALIYDTLVEALPRINFVLAEKRRDLMKYANVFGGAKMSALLRALGEL